MRPTTLLLPLVSLFASPVLSVNYCLGDGSAGYCTITSYTDKTTSVQGPPTTGECQDACRGVIGDAGDWIVDFKNKPAGYVQTMVGYPCAFSVSRGAGEPLNYSFFMTNQDIIDILDDVSNMYGPLHAGKVAAQGTMECQGRKAVWYVN